MLKTTHILPQVTTASAFLGGLRKEFKAKREPASALHLLDAIRRCHAETMRRFNSVDRALEQGREPVEQRRERVENDAVEARL